MSYLYPFEEKPVEKVVKRIVLTGGGGTLTTYGDPVVKEDAESERVVIVVTPEANENGR
jgi:hypothetical protein